MFYLRFPVKPLFLTLPTSHIVFTHVLLCLPSHFQPLISHLSIYIHIHTYIYIHTFHVLCISFLVFYEKKFISVLFFCFFITRSTLGSHPQPSVLFGRAMNFRRNSPLPIIRIEPKLALTAAAATALAADG